MTNITKTTKTILFASLIAAMILPFSGMDFAEAKKEGIKQKELDDRFAQVSEIYSDVRISELKEKISKAGENETIRSLENGLKILEKTKVKQIADNKYKIKTTVKVTNTDGEKAKTTVQYFVTENDDGSLFVQIPDAKPSEKSTIKNHDGLEFTIKPEQITAIPTVDATVGKKKFTMEVTKSINNNFVNGGDTFSQNCGMLPSTSASMYAAADASSTGQYWRAVSANVGGAWLYMDWCIFPNAYAGVDFEMGGSSYNDHNWAISPTVPGWGAVGGLQFPWDDLHFRTNVYYV